MNKKSTPRKNWCEERRMQAWKLHEQGWKQKDIATALGVTEGAVSQWFKKAREQGVEALKHQPPPGATAKLSAEQRAQFPDLLRRGAQAFGFRGQVWTTKRVAQMTEQQFGVKYHPAHTFSRSWRFSSKAWAFSAKACSFSSWSWAFSA